MNFDALGNAVNDATAILRASNDAAERLSMAAHRMAEQHARTATAILKSEVLQWATKYAAHIPPHALRELAQDVLGLKEQK